MKLLLFFIFQFVISELTLNFYPKSEATLEMISDQTNTKIKANENSFEWTYNGKKIMSEKDGKTQFQNLDNFQINLNTNFEVTNLKINGKNTWKLYLFDDFSYQQLGWQEYSQGSCSQNDNQFLKGNCNQKKFQRKIPLPPHTKIMIKFNFHFIDKWIYNTAYAYVDNQIIWSQQYNWCNKIMPWFCLKYNINSCDNEIPDQMYRHVQHVQQHKENELIFVIETDFDLSNCDASFGVDDFQIFLQ